MKLSIMLPTDMYNPHQGRIQEFVQGGLHFFLFPGGGSVPAGARKPPEINRFYWSRGA